MTPDGLYGNTHTLFFFPLRISLPSQKFWNIILKKFEYCASPLPLELNLLYDKVSEALALYCNTKCS